MNPQTVFCLTPECPARGQIEAGNVYIHSKSEKRYGCRVCQKTFNASKGSIFYRLRTDPAIVVMVITLMVYGCPARAIVAAFGLDRRTVKKWWQRAGAHCQGVHEHIVGQSQQDLQHVQADEVYVNTQKGSLWMAMVMAVRSRLWLGGAVSPKRDKGLIVSIAEQVKAVALCRPLLLSVDGLASYVSAFRQVFRTPIPRRKGQTGRSRLVAWPGIAIVQVVKQRGNGSLRIDRRIVQGTKAMIANLLQVSQGGTGMINTAYIERLNATFRQRLACLARRTRNLARNLETLRAGMFILGCVYNFCTPHRSLAVPLSLGERRTHWVPRSPAIAAGLTDHVWSIEELLLFIVPPPPWTPPKRRGRPSRAMLALIERWCPNHS